jgi:hypothetical protein
MALRRVDLPTFGRPTKVTKPLRTSVRVVANDAYALHEGATLDSWPEMIFRNLTFGSGLTKCNHKPSRSQLGFYTSMVFLIFFTS